MPKLGKLAAIHLFGALEVLLTGRLIDPLTGAAFLTSPFGR